MENIIVIGGGASGIIAALTAAEDKNNHVILIERQQRIGRKLLATGNGRCNLTNTGACPLNYHGENESFALPALEAFSPQDTLDFFEKLGLLTVTSGSETVAEIPLLAGEDVPRITYGQMLLRMLRMGLMAG